MNTAETLENWNERKVKLKHKFKYLTDNDLVLNDGKMEEMILKLQTKLGITKDELQGIFKTL